MGSKGHFLPCDWQISIHFVGFCIFVVSWLSSAVMIRADVFFLSSAILLCFFLNCRRNEASLVRTTTVFVPTEETDATVLFQRSRRAKPRGCDAPKHSRIDGRCGNMEATKGSALSYLSLSFASKLRRLSK